MLNTLWMPIVACMGQINARVTMFALSGVLWTKDFTKHAHLKSHRCKAIQDCR